MNVYWACSTTTATPIPAARKRSSPKSLAEIRCDFGRLPRARFGTVVFRDIGWRLWIAGTLGQRCFVKIVESIAKEKDVVAEAFFDKITTAAWQRYSGLAAIRDAGQAPCRRDHHQLTEEDAGIDDAILRMYDR